MVNKLRNSLFLILISLCMTAVHAQTTVSTFDLNTLKIAKLDTSNNAKIYAPALSNNEEILLEELTDEFLTSYQEGDYIKTGIIAQKTLEFSQRTFGKQHRNTADALNKLGIAHEAQGELDIAKSYYEDSLDMFEITLGKENAKVAMVLNNLGNLLFLQQGYSQAEDMHLRSLLMRQNLFSSIHPTVARSAYNLAKLYEKQAKHIDAILFYKQAAVLWKKTLGPQHLNVANTLNNLANVYAAQDNNTAAEELHLKALSIRETNLGPTHTQVAESLFNLGSICTKQEKYNEAQSFYQEALQIMENNLGVEDPQVAMTLYSLANIYHIQAQQEYIYNQELDDRINTVNNSNKNASTNNKNNIMIGQLKFRQTYVGEIFSKAEPLYRRAINIVESNFGSEHPSVQVMKDELSMLYTNMENSVNEPFSSAAVE